MKSSRSIKGAALGTVVMCVVVLATILFIAVSASISHLRVVTAAESQEHARNLADSAIAQAIHQIAETGTAGDISVTINGVDGEGALTFNPSAEPRAYSSNNFDGTGAVSGTRGRVVPPRTIHLVGKGQVGSAVSYVECLYYRPPFPDGLVATGPVKASALELYGIRRDEAYAGGDPSTIPPEDTMPGNLYSNYTDGWDATAATVRLLDESDVSGSLGAVGSVTVDGTSVVGGEVLPGSAPRPMAELDIPAKIAVLKPNAIPVGSGGNLTLDPNWFSISSGDLSLNGDLDLNGSALLVEGDLEVRGAVSGTGVILVDGEVRILDGGTDLVAGEQTAIACTKNFTLQAASPEGNYFKGLVYCQGDFLAKDITVVGATVVNAENNLSARGQAELENVRFVYNPGSVSVGVSAVLGHADRVSRYTYAIKLLAARNSTDDGFDFTTTIYACNNYNRSKELPTRPQEWPNAPRETLVETLPVISVLDTNLSSRPIKQELTTWVENRFMGNIGERRRKNLSDLEYQIDLAFAELTGPVPDSSAVTLNLNSLLGEFLSTSRVLLWRTLED